MPDYSQPFKDGMKARKTGAPCAASVCPYFGDKLKEWVAGWNLQHRVEHDNNDAYMPDAAHDVAEAGD